MQKLLLSVLAALALPAFATVSLGQSSDRPLNEIDVRITFTVPSGEANFSGTNNSGDTISFDRDFDFKDEFGYELRFTHKSENLKHKFLAQYSSTDWERTRTLTRSFTFRGNTYVANFDATGKLKLRSFRGMYAYRWGNEKFRFGPMADMGIINTKINITGTTNNGTRSGEASLTKFAATIGYDLDYDPNSKLNIFHNLGAIAFRGEHFFHTEGGVKVFLARSFGVTGGYSAVRYKLNDNDNFITIKAHGPFFGGVLRF
jgi:hypothetical protein